MKRIRWLAGTVAIMLGLAGCDGLFKICRTCLEGDIDQPVPSADVSMIKVIFGNQPLPNTARNIYYAEGCGIDCSEILRFDLPSSIAEGVMLGMAGQPLRPLSDWEQQELIRRWRGLGPDGPAHIPHWWIHAEVAEARGVSAVPNAETYLSFLLEPRGDLTRVYLASLSW